MSNATPLTIPFRALRTHWLDEPDVDIHQTDERLVREHPDYADAKAGDGEAAVRLVDDTINLATIEALRQRQWHTPLTLLPVVAEESDVANAIPLAMAQRLSLALGWEVEAGIIQSNVAARTHAQGWLLQARHPAGVRWNCRYTRALSAGRRFRRPRRHAGQPAWPHHGPWWKGRRVHFTCSKVASGRLALRSNTLTTLRNIHGECLENWWRQVFGFDFERLTESEARWRSQI